MGGANPNAINDDGYEGFAPVHVAAKHGSVDVIRYLVEDANVNVEQRTRIGLTVLHVACCWDHFALVQYLCDACDANVEAQSELGYTALHYASNYGYPDIARYLVEQKQADVAAKDHFGNTPLDECLSRGEDEVVRVLFGAVPFIDDKILRRFFADLCSYWDIRGAVLEKYAAGRALTDAFRRNPIHTVLSEFPLPSTEAFEDYILATPDSALSMLDLRGRLPIHIVLTSQKKALKSSSVVTILWEREKRASIERDPTTGFYPHETVASLTSKDHDDSVWLDVIYELFRSNPQQVQQARRVGG